MNVGMLWLDDDKQVPLDEKVRRAADYYESKYGRAPNLCFVNTGMLSEAIRVGAVRVQPARNVLPHHFWIGLKMT